MEQKRYIARNGADFTNEDAEKIGPELERLEKEGKTAPADIVKSARSNKSVLHQYFEWDDAKAAEQHRLHRARLLVNHIEVEIIVHDRKPERYRAFHSVVVGKDKEGKNKRAYVSHETVQSSEDYSRQVIEDAQNHLSTWRSRFAQYRDIYPAFNKKFSPVFKAIDQLESKKAA